MGMGSLDRQYYLQLCATTGQPSLFKQFNSLVKQFSIEGFSDDVQRRGWPPNSYAHDASGLFDIYERADRLFGDPLTNIRRPIGCLHFWSEEVRLGEIVWRFEAVDVNVETTENPVFPFLYTKGLSKRCGIIALPSSLQDTIRGSESAMSFVLLSECRNFFQMWPAYGKLCPGAPLFGFSGALPVLDYFCHLRHLVVATPCLHRQCNA